MDTRQEVRLVLLAQAGHLSAFDELLQSVQSQLYRYIYNLVSDQHLAEDILQEVFILIYRKLEWLQEPALFRPWAYRIATREVFKRKKREREWVALLRDEQLMANVAAPTPLADSELLRELPKLIMKVSPASRVALVLHYLQGLTLEETAAVLDIAVGTVKSRIAYGINALRQYLIT